MVKLGILLQLILLKPMAFILNPDFEIYFWHRSIWLNYWVIVTCKLIHPHPSPCRCKWWRLVWHVQDGNMKSIQKWLSIPYQIHIMIRGKSYIYYILKFGTQFVVFFVVKKRSILLPLFMFISLALGQLWIYMYLYICIYFHHFWWACITIQTYLTKVHKKICMQYHTGM